MTADWDWDAEHPDNEGVYYDERGRNFTPGSPAWTKRMNLIRMEMGLPDLPPPPIYDTPEDKLIAEEGGPERVYPVEFSGLPTVADLLQGKEAGHDLLTTGEPMAFDRAWSLVKLARQKVGPTEMWDINERDGGVHGSAEADDPIWEEMGLSHLRFNPPYSWNDPNKNRGLGHWDANYLPMGGSPWFADMADKVRMTPSEYLSLTTETGEFPRSEEYVGRMAESMSEGFPLFIPNLNISRRGDVGWDSGAASEADYRVKGHEGRNRMAALRSLIGDVRVPVQISSDEFGEGTWNLEGDEPEWQRTRGGVSRPSPAMRQALTGALLGGQFNRDVSVPIEEFEDEMWD